jgi:metal-responsive CopG/Arc/MetJ family transcriptional regulator
MTTTIATSLPQDDLMELDRLRRYQGLTRAEAVRAAIRWYVAADGQRELTEDPIFNDF